MRKLALTLLVATGLLEGCGDLPDAAVDEEITQTSSPLTNSPFTLRNYQTGLCMGVRAGNPAVTTTFATWACDGTPNQTFHKGEAYPSDPSAFWLVNHVAADRCVHGNAANGVLPFILNCIQDIHEYWRPVFSGYDFSGHECYRFQSAQNPTKLFGVRAGITSPGTDIMVWDDFNDRFGHPDQFWCIY